MTETVETRWEGHNENGRRAFAQGDYAQAEQSFIAAIREATLLGADNARLATSLSNLAQLKYRQKDLAQAEALFRRSLAIRERVLDGDHVGLVQNINNLAALHYTRGELAQAEPLFRRALDISEKTLGESHPDVAVTLSNLARLCFRKNDFSSAAPLLLRLLSIKEHALGPDHPEVAAIVASLAKVRAAEGDLNAAEQLARRALASKESAAKADDPSLAPSLEALADVLAGRGKHDEERQLRERAVRLRGQSPNRTPTAAPSLTVELKPVTATAAPAAPRKSGSAPRTNERTEPRTGPMRDSTKSTTLPWIEPPTSPALRRPAPPAPIEQPMSSAPAFAAVTMPPAPEVTRFTPPAPSRVEPTTAPKPAPARVEDTAWASPHAPRAELHDHVSDSTSDESADVPEWTPAPRRNWVKVFAGAAAVVVVGAASWALFLDHPAGGRDASTVSATAGSVALRSKAVQHPAAQPASAAASPAPVETSHSGESHPTPEKSTAESKPAVSTPADVKSSESKERATARVARQAAADGTAPPVGSLPTIDLNAAANSVTEKAKQRVDSVGRAITVKPPTFDKSKPSQP